MKLICDECKKATSGEVGGCVLELDRSDNDKMPTKCPYEESFIPKWEIPQSDEQSKSVSILDVLLA